MVPYYKHLRPGVRVEVKPLVECKTDTYMNLTGSRGLSAWYLGRVITNKGQGKLQVSRMNGTEWD